MEIKPENHDLSAERDEKVLPIARKLLKLLADREDLNMGSRASIKTQEEAAKYYQKVYQDDVVPLLLEHNMKLNDIPYLFSVMLQPIQFTSDITTSSIEMNRDLADAKKYGLKDIQDICVDDIDTALKDKV